MNEHEPIHPTHVTIEPSRHISVSDLMDELDIYLEGIYAEDFIRAVTHMARGVQTPTLMGELMAKKWQRNAKKWQRNGKEITGGVVVD